MISNVALERKNIMKKFYITIINNIIKRKVIARAISNVLIVYIRRLLYYLYHKLEEPQVREAVTSLLTVLLTELIYKIIQAF